MSQSEILGTLFGIITLTKQHTANSPAPSPEREAGAPEIEVTAAMIEAGLEWLYAYDPDRSDGRETIKHIIRAALAMGSPEFRDYEAFVFSQYIARTLAPIR